MKRFLLLIVPAVLIAIVVFLVFGFLGACAMSACLGSGSPSTGDKLFGAAAVVAASLPLAASMTVFIAHSRRVRLGSVVSILLWVVVGLAGALGVYQVLVDPGDAIWAGIPLIVFSTLLSFSILELSKPQNTN
jgi:uncharacterized membrane protein